MAVGQGGQGIRYLDYINVRVFGTQYSVTVLCLAQLACQRLSSLRMG